MLKLLQTLWALMPDKKLRIWRTHSMEITTMDSTVQQSLPNAVSYDESESEYLNQHQPQSINLP